jgi:DNA-binding NarL/FixJ family response regulator
MMKVRVLLVDGHEQFSNTLRAMLQSDPDIEVVKQARSVKSAIEAMTRFPFDVICLDMRVGGLGGIGTTRLLLQQFPHTRVIGLSIHDDPVLVQGLTKAGASGFVLKMDAGRDLAPAIHRVHDTVTYMTHSMSWTSCTDSQGITSSDRSTRGRTV